MNANAAQKSAITHVNGPMMVLAGPGSGKTFVITERIRYLIETAQIPPEHILVITFTKAAALQMEKRFQRLIGRKRVPVYFGTFHAVFFHILRHTFPYRPQDILKQEEQYRFMQEIIAQQNLDVMYQSQWIEQMLAQVSCRKNHVSIRKPEEHFEEVYQSYLQKCKDAGKLDFDDMVLQCLKLFQTSEDVLRKWQERFRYILIDEFQDINPMQYEVVKLLSAKTKHLFIVGDDDQSIYGFRGARPEIMLGFEKDFNCCRKVTLNVNYRSHEEIISLAHKLIKHNKRRFKKHLISDKKVGGSVLIRQYEDVDMELAAVQDEIRKLHETIPYHEMAILYRTGIGEKLLRHVFSNEIAQGLVTQTIHGAKGLEYEIVFVLDVIDGNIPHRKAKKRYESEEERRLLYVAITRARQSIYLMSVRKYLEKRTKESRFLREIKSAF